MSFQVTAQPLTAQAWLVADSKGIVIDGAHVDDVRSIASITKLMTVIAILDSQLPLDEVINKKLHNRLWTRQQLIDLSLVSSDNNAAKLLCDTYPGGMDACVNSMNKKAKDLGMTQTYYVEPTGLMNENVSTAVDLLKLVTAASKYPVIVAASNMDSVKVETQSKNKKHTTISFPNTNTLVGKGQVFFVSKTGWIRRSGGCIVMMVNTANGIRTVILLGSKNTKTRIPEAKMIASAY